MRSPGVQPHTSAFPEWPEFNISPAPPRQVDLVWHAVLERSSHTTELSTGWCDVGIGRYHIIWSSLLWQIGGVNLCYFVCTVTCVVFIARMVNRCKKRRCGLNLCKIWSHVLWGSQQDPRSSASVNPAFHFHSSYITIRIRIYLAVRSILECPETFTTSQSHISNLSCAFILSTRIEISSYSIKNHVFS